MKKQISNIVVMGVSGCGKTTLAKELAKKLDLVFIEGDDFHPKANVDKMAAGNPLTNEDRKPWLEELNRIMKQINGTVVSCSALKSSYRKILQNGVNELLFIHLEGSFDLIHNRMKARSDHFMPAELLQSQFDILENPTNAFVININKSKEDILDEALAYLTK